MRCDTTLGQDGSRGRQPGDSVLCCGPGQEHRQTHGVLQIVSHPAEGRELGGGVAVVGNVFQSVLDRLKSRARRSGMSDADPPGKLSVRSVWRRNRRPADIVAFAALHVPHVDVLISAFWRCTGHPSRMTKRPYAGIGPSKPCVAGVYPACWKARQPFRLPADTVLCCAHECSITPSGDRQTVQLTLALG